MGAYAAPEIEKNKWKSACKPGSVWDSHSSGTCVAARLKQPTREPARAAPFRAKARCAPLFGLAPGGVYPAAIVANGAVRSYHTISPLPSAQGPMAVYFLWHFPWIHIPQALPGTLPCGARTFLPTARAMKRLPGRLPAPSLRPAPGGCKEMRRAMITRSASFSSSAA